MARRARKSKADFAEALQSPNPIADPVADLSETIPGLTTADKLPSPADQLSPEEIEQAARRLGVSGNVDETQLPSPLPPYSDRVRPEGPRPRTQGEGPTLHSDPVHGFKLVQRGAYLQFHFDQEPSNDQIRKLYDQRFYRMPQSTTWACPASPSQIDAAYRLANEMSGKSHVYDGRGR